MYGTSENQRATAGRAELKYEHDRSAVRVGCKQSEFSFQVTVVVFGLL